MKHPLDKTTRDAPAKLILFGEHAVVYGHPAVALPLLNLRARATVEETPGSGPIQFELGDFGCRYTVGDEVEDKVALSFKALAELLGERVPGLPAHGWKCTVSSDIPPGCGLGSGAAVTTAVLRAVHGFFSIPATPSNLSKLTFEIEKLHHGKPSGIDNTVVAMEKPLVFRRGKEIVFLTSPNRSLFFVIGYTGMRHETSEVVGDVAEAYTADPGSYDAIFRKIGDISEKGAAAFETGNSDQLGVLMRRNQQLLRDLGVSCRELDDLVETAESAGAAGAKLSGAGRGGCMVAVASSADTAEKVGLALEKAGAAWVKLSETSHRVSMQSKS